MGDISAADHSTCGMSVAIDVVGGKWKLHLMWVLGPGPQRFGQIRRLLEGVSEKVLAENLRQLEGSGVVQREVFAEVPPRVEYSLTPLGKELRIALLPLEAWGDTNRHELLGNLLAPTSSSVSPQPTPNGGVARWAHRRVVCDSESPDPLLESNA